MEIAPTMLDTFSRSGMIELFRTGLWSMSAAVGPNGHTQLGGNT